jgi:very-short-patch-repair endonuclease
VIAVPPKSPIDNFRRATAKRLRANTTDAEDKLWRHLRRLEMHDSHFRRQVPIGTFVVDFACMAAKLLIEVDGSQHSQDANLARDKERTAWLESEGYRMLRFWNNDITANINGVLEAIYAALYGSNDSDLRKLTHRRVMKSHPTPALRADPPPPGEGETSFAATPNPSPQGGGEKSGSAEP